MVQKRAVLFSGWLPNDSGGAEITKGICEELTAEGYDAHVPTSNSRTNEEQVQEERRRIQQCIENPKIAGLIIMFLGDHRNLALIRALRDGGKAVVFLERMCAEEQSFDRVSIDNIMSSRKIVEHLIAQGHRSIAHITTKENALSAEERVRGYRQALDRASLPYRPELVVPHENDRRGISISPRLIHSLLTHPNPPTAIFAVHDWAALLTVYTAHLSGLRIPQQLAVAGFDGIERFRMDAPLLTTAEIPFTRLGTHAARLILDRLEGRLKGEVRHVSLEAPLQIRLSTQKETSVLLQDNSAWRRRLIYHYMQNNLSEPLTIEDLASVASVSVTTLFQDFRQGGDESPIQILHSLRMDQIRWELSHPSPDLTVSRCITKWGVHHQGRFASLYRSKYGETPHDTLQSSLGRKGQCLPAKTPLALN